MGVSIPFIAGQWSLHDRRRGVCRTRQRSFNPLHCGAVVSSHNDRLQRNPRLCFNPLHCGAVVSSGKPKHGRGPRRKSFNPLHCGAVVSSGRPAGRPRRRTGFNPLHCGAVVSSKAGGKEDNAQWKSCFNPLHCGAVVSSATRASAGWRRSVSIPFIAGQWSLRGGQGGPPHDGSRVSIPFIAGQWSLLLALCLMHLGRVFQSPSLRGSGLFPPPRTIIRGVADAFQSPSLRGSGLFRRNGRGRRRGRGVSIPFIAGQWSLPARRRRLPEALCLVSIPFIAGQWSLPRWRGRATRRIRRAFQSPSLRGSGLFKLSLAWGSRVSVFQSPSLRGSGRFGASAPRPPRTRPPFQSPSLRGSGRFRCGPLVRPPKKPASFNPLHCGAVVASPSHNALPSLRRPAAEFATCLRPPSLGVLAQVA